MCSAARVWFASWGQQEIDGATRKMPPKILHERILHLLYRAQDSCFMKQKLCPLCEKPSPLVRSHVVPEGFYRLIYDKNSKHKAVFGSKMRGTFSPIQKGLKQPLLCERCDNAIVGPYDKYAIDVVRDGKKCIRAEWPEGLGFLNVDAEKLRIFYLSVIWRAHHATIPPYENISLEYADERLIRTAILTGIAPPSNDYPVFGCVLVNSREKNTIVTEIVGATTRCPWPATSGKHVFVAMFGGIAWHCIMANGASVDPNSGLFFSGNTIWLPRQDIFQFEPFQNVQATIDLIAAGEHIRAPRKPVG